MVLRFVDRGLSVRKELKYLCRIEPRESFGDVSRTAAGRVSNLRDELEIASYRFPSSQSHHLTTHEDGELVGIEILKPSD
jgi:hypothetical protein